MKRETREVEDSLSVDFLNLMVYGVKRQKEAQRPDTRGLMQLNAAVELVEQGLVTTIIIPGVEDYGIRISEIYANELNKKINSKRIIDIDIIIESKVLSAENVDTGSKDTGGALDFLFSQAQEHGWQKGVCLYYRPHLQRIIKLLKSRKIKTLNTCLQSDGIRLELLLKSSHDVLSQKHPNFSERFENSPFKKEQGNTFHKREKRKLMFMKLVDPQGILLSFIAHKMPQQLKEKFQS
jgi:hypothetical protein